VFLFSLSLYKLKERDMKVNVTVKAAEGIIQQYELNINPVDVLATFEEARQVWDEYHVEFKSEDPIAPFELYCTQTYKEESMRRQWLLDLHEEVAGEE
jgi:hypothetical protein